jgi:hypothetical protein
MSADMANVLAAMVGVSVIYYALLFYATLCRKLIGGALRLAERLRPVRHR